MRKQKYFTDEERLRARRLKSKRHYLKHRDVIRKKSVEIKRKYYLKHRNEILKKRKEYFLGNREKIKQNHKLHYEKNRELVSIRGKEYYKKNRKRILARAIEYEKKRIQTDINYKLRKRLKARVKMVLKNNYKSGMAIRVLGCSVEDLRKHLESKFQIGMSWENYGEWHIDHIIPCNSFDLTSEDAQQKCFHFSNLQPLWASDNLKKNDRLNYVVGG